MERRTKVWLPTQWRLKENTVTRLIRGGTGFHKPRRGFHRRQ